MAPRIHRLRRPAVRASARGRIGFVLRRRHHQGRRRWRWPARPRHEASCRVRRRTWRLDRREIAQFDRLLVDRIDAPVAFVDQRLLAPGSKNSKLRTCPQSIFGAAVAFSRSENRDARSRRARSRLVPAGLPARLHLPGHPSPTRFACRKTQSGGAVGGVGCCVDPPYHVVLAVKVCVSAGAPLRPSVVFEP